MTAVIRIGCSLALAVLTLIDIRPAFSCACCSNEGQRNVATTALDSGKRQDIESLRFGGKATLFTGEGDVEGIQGIITPSASYHLVAKWQDNRLVLSLRDSLGRAGTLSFARPKTVSLFEVDPRNGPDRGHGPVLYKEWKLSGPASAAACFSRAARRARSSR
jgi:hypothetical protein